MNNKKTTYFVVGVLEKDHMSIGILGGKYNLDLNWADGMVGVMPVFDNEIAAKKYAGDKFKIFRLGIVKGD